MLWDVIYNKLKSEGIEVYTPGQHKGDCTTNYVVVRPSGTNQFMEYSTDVMYCDVMCYVPLEHFSQLKTFVDRVKGILKKLYPQVKDAHMEVPGFIDDSNKSHMWSIQYQSYRQFFNL